MRQLALAANHPYSYEIPDTMAELWQAAKDKGWKWHITESDDDPIAILMVWNEQITYQATARQKDGLWTTEILTGNSPENARTITAEIMISEL